MDELTGPSAHGRADPPDVVVLAGGETVDAGTTTPIPGSATVIAADSGLALAEALGLSVDVVIGDMDSVAAAQLERARADGARVERHPVSKDRTDLALAMDEAMALTPTHLLVVGGYGGRLDHQLSNLALLASQAYAGVRVTANMGPAVVTVLRGGQGERTLAGRPGELVSLIPMHGTATGVTTRGLRFALDDEPLWPGSSRGVSNAFVQDRARVRLRDGVLLAVQPDGGRPGRRPVSSGHP